MLSSKPAWLDPNKHHFLLKTDQISFALQPYLDTTLLEDAATFKSEFREEDHSEGGWCLDGSSMGFSVMKDLEKNPIFRGVTVLSLDITYDQWPQCTVAIPWRSSHVFPSTWSSFSCEADIVSTWGGRNGWFHMKGFESSPVASDPFVTDVWLFTYNTNLLWILTRRSQNSGHWSSHPWRWMNPPPSCNISWHAPKKGGLSVVTFLRIPPKWWICFQVVPKMKFDMFLLCFQKRGRNFLTCLYMPPPTSWVSCYSYRATLPSICYIWNVKVIVETTHC